MNQRTDGSTRPTMDDVLDEVALVLAQRSTCPEGARHGAVIAVDGRIVATGYGSPATGDAPCERCWLREKFALTGIKDWTVCPSVHAEANAIGHAARYGVSVAGGTLHVTRPPCDPCRRLLRNAGVRNFTTPGGRKADL